MTELQGSPCWLAARAGAGKEEARVSQGPPPTLRPPLLPLQVDSVTGGSPLSNQFYLAAPQGACYGADHDLGRLHPGAMASMRAQSPIPNLYLTGTLKAPSCQESWASLSLRVLFLLPRWLGPLVLDRRHLCGPGSGAPVFPLPCLEVGWMDAHRPPLLSPRPRHCHLWVGWSPARGLAVQQRHPEAELVLRPSEARIADPGPEEKELVGSGRSQSNWHIPCLTCVFLH